MIRILIFILLAIFFAGTITVLASIDGRVQAEAFGLRLDVHSGFAFGLIVAFFALAVYATMLVKDLMTLPQRLKAKEAEVRRARGVEALTRGLEAVAVGDAAGAQHHARTARRNLDESSLTRLLTAQAAYLAGEETAAHESFNAMLAAPETEFLGLRGLYLQAVRKGDKAAARNYAERAFRLRSNAKWAFDSVVELGLERGAWGETRDAIVTALNNKIIAADAARRGEAALLAADAYAARTSGDAAQALDEAEAALKLSPGFAPAAVLASNLHAEAGRRPRAAKILEQAFSEAPYPALIAAHNTLYASEDFEMRAERMKRIADRRPTAREAKLQYARRHILLAEYTDAAGLLEPLLVEAATARECELMAAAVGGAEGPEGSPAGRAWISRAARARHDPSPGAEGAFQFTREGWARTIREYMEHGRLAPPPLEDAPAGISAEEIKLLAAPKPEPDEPAEAKISADEHGTLDEDDPEAAASEAARAVSAAGSVS